MSFNFSKFARGACLSSVGVAVITLVSGSGKMGAVTVLTTFHVGSDPGLGPVVLRRAEAADLPAIVGLLAADELGAARDGVRDAADLAAYERAFRAIDGDPAHLLLVAESPDGIAATLQLSFIPGLARRGSLRAQIEAVRVAGGYRGSGLGTAIFKWAIGEGRRRGCSLVQLTTDKSRTDAHRFYERLGFVASHEGLKLAL